MTEFVLTLDEILAKNPCVSKAIVLKYGEGNPYWHTDKLVMPEGWTKEVIDWYVKNRVDNFIWMAYAKLIPVSYDDARAACGKTPKHASVGHS